MAVLSAMQSAAIRLLGQRPGTFYGSTNVFEMEITDLVNEVAQDVVQYRDWQELTRFATVTGDGAETTFSLPSDYSRMLIDSEIQSPTNWAWGYARVMDANQFRWLQDSGWGPWPGVWTIQGNQLLFTPAPAAASEAVYPYISANYAVDAGTLAAKAAFTSDTDTFLLPERLLTLGLVWRWRENKKLDASGDQEAFVKALEEYAAKSSGARSYSRNSRRHLAGVSTAWPWTLGGV
jgi:hypothetical protein